MKYFGTDSDVYARIRLEIVASKITFLIFTIYFQAGIFYDENTTLRKQDINGTRNILNASRNMKVDPNHKIYHLIRNL